MMEYKELDLTIKRSLSGRIGGYFNRLNFREEPMPCSKFELYRNLLKYFQISSEYARVNKVDHYEEKVDLWLKTYEGRKWLSEKCEDWWNKWYPLKDEKGMNLSYWNKRNR